MEVIDIFRTNTCSGNLTLPGASKERTHTLPGHIQIVLLALNLALNSNAAVTGYIGYSDVEACRTLSLADRVRSPVGEKMLFPFLHQLHFAPTSNIPQVCIKLTEYHFT